MQFDTTIAVKDRKRYELNQFRGVDTTSAPSDVSPKRATYMRNFENRGGVNHKRYGWAETDVSDKFNGKVCSTFKAKIKGVDVEFFKVNINGEDDIVIPTLIARSKDFEEDIVHTCEHLNENDAQFYYSNDRVYIIGCGEYDVFGEFDEQYSFKRVDETNDIYAPLVLTNIDHDGVENDKVEALEDYNLLTHNVRFGLVGAETANPTYTLPHKVALNSSSFLKINDDEYTVFDVGLSQTTAISKAEQLGVISEGSNRYVNKLKFKLSDYPTKSEKNSKLNTVEARFSNGYYLKWVDLMPSNDSENYTLCLYDNNDNIVIIGGSTAIGLTISNTIKSGTLIKYNYTESEIDISGISAFDGGVTITYLKTQLTCKLSIYGTFPKSNGFSIYKSETKSDSNKIANIDGNKISFISNSLKPQVEGETNIFIQVEDLEYKPNFDINSANLSCLFGGNGANDRIFINGVTELKKDKKGEYTGNESINHNVVFWSEVSDNGFYDGKAFTYFAETSYTSIGATQNKVTGMTRLNDSTLAIFREHQIGENNFSILTATYKQTETTSQDFSLDLVVSVASANMPQTAVNDNCFGTLGKDVLFASKEGVYAIAISNGTSVERYAIERSDPIANMFKDLDMDNAKAISFKNKYYLAAKNTKTREDLVLVADARYSYSLDRNMDDTFNYEWYIWNNCPVQKWIIENGKLGFYDNEGCKCLFHNELDNEQETTLFTDIKKTTSKEAIKYEGIDRYTISNDFIGKVFKFTSGLKYKDGTDVPENSSIYLRLHMFQKMSQKPDTIYCYLYVVNTDGTLSKVDTYIVDTLSQTEYIQNQPVSAIWFTPTLDFGASDYKKTIFKMTLGVDRDSKGSIVMGYRTKYDDKDVVSKAYIGGTQLDLSDLGFSFLSFGRDFDTSYTNNMKIRDFTNIQFFFGNNVGMDVALNNLTVLYKYNKFNRGVR